MTENENASIARMAEAMDRMADAIERMGERLEEVSFSIGSLLDLLADDDDPGAPAISLDGEPTGGERNADDPL